MPPKRNTKAAKAEGETTAATAASGNKAADENQSNDQNNTNRMGADEKYKTGPFSLLYNAVHVPGTQVLILCRNQKRLFARVRAFDRHFNMLLEDAQELSSEKDSVGNPRMRSLPKLFLRGDSVISVVSMKK